MRFYHYTGEPNVRPIRELGIIAGPQAFAELGIEGVAAVWLTTSDDWTQQHASWASRMPGDRTAARVAIDLSVAETNIWQWSQLGARLCAMAGGELRVLAEHNERHPGYQEWWVYLRNIAPQRILGVEVRGPRTP